MTRNEATQKIQSAISKCNGFTFSSDLFRLMPEIYTVYERFREGKINAREFYKEAEDALIISSTPLAQAMK